MYLNEVKVKNYRSLKDVKLVLDKEKGTPNLSLIIGKNNSGKTSFLKIMKKMIAEDRKLSWDDFNIQYRREIHNILVSKEEGNEEEIIDRYRSQLKYYKDALEKITEKKVMESYLYLFGIDKEVLL